MIVFPGELLLCQLYPGECPSFVLSSESKCVLNFTHAGQLLRPTGGPLTYVMPCWTSAEAASQETSPRMF